MKNTGSAAMTGWKVVMTLPDGVSVQHSWGGTLTGSGSTVTVTNEAWNGGLAANASTTFGFIGAGTIGTATPGLTCSRN